MSLRNAMKISLGFHLSNWLESQENNKTQHREAQKKKKNGCSHKSLMGL